MPGLPARQQVAGGAARAERRVGREEKEEERRREAKPARCAAGPVDYNWGREGAFASRWWAAGSGGEHEGGRMGASNGKQYGSEGEQRGGGSWLGDSRSSGERGHPAVSPVACSSPPSRGASRDSAGVVAIELRS